MQVYLQMRTSEERMAKLRGEMLLREDSYNNHFKNGGAGARMLNANSAMNAQVMAGGAFLVFVEKWKWLQWGVTFSHVVWLIGCCLVSTGHK